MKRNRLQRKQLIAMSIGKAIWMKGPHLGTRILSPGLTQVVNASHR